MHTTSGFITNYFKTVKNDFALIESFFSFYIKCRQI